VPGEVFVLKRSSVVALHDSSGGLLLFTWVCPLCGRRVTGYSSERTLLYARQHVEKKHKLKVIVE
jgi:hypothetical protein